MAIFTLGINHHSAPLAVRERVAFSADNLPRALQSLISRLPGARSNPVREAAILSTCNRTELYCSTDEPEAAVDWLTGFHQLPRQMIEPYLYTLPQTEAVRHAFRVASGLDSMVIGEPQILGQMKDAVRLAEEAGTLGTLLNKLFQRSFAVAKEVRSTTAIGANTVSMAAASVHLAERIFERIAEQQILFIGAGEMIELCATHFAAQSPKRLAVANRTLANAEALASRFNGTALRLDDIAEQLAQFDIVVSCTASPLPIIGLGLVERAIKARRHRPMFIVDLAVPRDVEPEVGEMDDVFLYTVDDLALVVESGLEARQAAVVEAEAIITDRVDHFIHWLEVRDAVPLIRALRDNAERARRHEVERALKLLAKGRDPEEVLERLSHRLANKLTHAPTRALNNVDSTGRDELQSAVSRLYNLHAHNNER